MLAELAQAVRERRVSAVELVSDSLARIERHNAELNAVTALRAEPALEDARAVDALAVLGTEQPLAGLPLLVKDNTDVAGMVTTFGSRTRADAAPAERSELTVERLVQAGAVIVGRTNVPEFAFQGWTDNDLVGATRNPWGLEWSPGGSSGGSGAAIAAGLAAIATGTDGGGSIRIPAALCGYAGLKPTNGLIGRSPTPSWMDLSTQGPMATSIADLRLLLELIRGPVHGDPTAIPRWRPGGATRPRRVLAAPRTWDFGPLPSEVDEPFRAAIVALEGDLGLHVEEVLPADLFPSVAGTEHTSGDDWFTLVAAEELGWLGRAFVREHLEAFSAPFRFTMGAALEISLDAYLDARRRRFGYVRDTDNLLGEDAVLLTPTLGYQGWLADGTLPGTSESLGGQGYNNGEANLTGHPSLSVPAGACANGLPFGLQITGPRFRDDLVLEVGAMWESAHPWLLAAPGYEPFGAGVVA